MVDKLLYIFTKIGQKLSKVSLVKSLQSLSVTTAKIQMMLKLSYLV